MEKLLRLPAVTDAESLESLVSLLRAVTRFLRYIHVSVDYDRRVAAHTKALRAHGTAELLMSLLPVVSAFVEMERDWSEAVINEDLHLFRRPFLNLLFRRLGEADQNQEAVRNLFPLYVLCWDYDRVKKLNSRCGGNYPMANMILSGGNKILRAVARGHPSAAPGNRLASDASATEVRLPDIPCQFQSGDENVLVLPYARSMADALRVGERFQEKLAEQPLIGHSGETGKGRRIVRWNLSAKIACCEITHLGPDVKPGRIIGSSFEQIHDLKGSGLGRGNESAF